MLKLILFVLASVVYTQSSENYGIIPFWSLNKLSLVGGKNFNEVPKQRVGEWGEKVTLNWLSQPVDHFNETDKRTFLQRYLKNDEYFKEGGPLIIMVGGEWSLDFPGMGRFLDEGTLYEVAAENNGLLLYPEHRFYGQTQPFNNTLPSSFKFLSVEQALEDLADFIKFIKGSDSRFANAKVILAGASYSALLSSFFKTKYPHLSDGAWASSAPTETRSETGPYRVLSGEVYKKYGGQTCYDTLRDSYLKIEDMLDAGNVEPLEEAFKLCEKIDSDPKSKLHFMTVITSVIASHVAESTPERLAAICNTAISAGDPVSAISQIFQYTFISEIQCLPTNYQSYVNFLKHPEEMEHPSNAGGIVQWFYQTCTEIGLYQTSILPNQPFGRKTSLDGYIPFCKDVFGFE